MKWTQEHPTKPGLYWYRKDENSDSDGVEIFLEENRLYFNSKCSNEEIPVTVLCQPESWWNGPLKAPKFEKPKVKPEYGWPRFRDIPEPERSAFKKFMIGQTVPYIPGLEPGESDFYYPWDYENFKSKNPVFD